MSEPERRSIQRIVTTQPGHKAFWLHAGGARMRLLDLSMAGFAVARDEKLAADEDFDFRIERDGEAEPVCGKAHVVNRLPDGQLGCVILSLIDSGRTRLHAWLAEHVMACSAVPLSPEEAESIIEGPSIV